MRNEVRKICSCGASFVARSSGGVTLTDGSHCIECTFQLKLEAARTRAKNEDVQ